MDAGIELMSYVVPEGRQGLQKLSEASCSWLEQAGTRMVHTAFNRFCVKEICLKEKLDEVK